MIWSVLGAIGLAVAVSMGAFGAHALKGRLDVYQQGIYEKAVFYQFIHALGLLIVSVLPKAGIVSQSAASWASGLLVAGIVFFCGSLYLIALTGARAFGAVAPIGGLSFIVAWCLLAYALLRRG